MLPTKEIIKLSDQPNPGLKEYMTAEEMAEYFNISKGTVGKWRKQGLVYIRIGSITLYPAKEVRNFLKLYERCDYER